MRKAKPDIQVHFSSKEERNLKYEDSYPDGFESLEDVKKEHGVVVWCKYKECINNKVLKGLQRTSGTLLKKISFTPIVEQDAIWPGVCTRDEIGIQFQEVRGQGGSKVKVPSCFVSATNKTGHMDFSRLLQSDGTPYGGNIDSQHSSQEIGVFE